MHEIQSGEQLGSPSTREPNLHVRLPALESEPGVGQHIVEIVSAPPGDFPITSGQPPGNLPIVCSIRFASLTLGCHRLRTLFKREDRA